MIRRRIRALVAGLTGWRATRPTPVESPAPAPFAPPIAGKASIIIVSYQGLDLIQPCVDSILRDSSYPDYELIIVDNGSTSDVTAYLQGLEQRHAKVRIILNGSNLGFAAANNIGIQSAIDSAYIVLLNNDTVTPRGWLVGLLRHLQRPEVGLVGPVTNWTGNEARIPVRYTDIADMESFAAAYTAAHQGQHFDIRVAAMYCVAIRQSVLQEVGLLDERFGIGMFEDEDYARRVRQAGYRVICAEDVYIHHQGSASFSKLDDAVYRALFERNKQLYEEKWGTRWEPYQARNW